MNEKYKELVGFRKLQLTLNIDDLFMVKNGIKEIPVSYITKAEDEQISILVNKLKELIPELLTVDSDFFKFKEIAKSYSYEKDAKRGTGGTTYHFKKTDEV